MSDRHVNVKSSYPYYLANRAIHLSKSSMDDEKSTIKVYDKYTGDVLTSVHLANQESIQMAIEKAVACKHEMASFPHYKRKQVLLHVVDRIKERSEEFSRMLALEAGKPIIQARAEVNRTIDTFTLAAEECTRITGECGSLDISPQNDGLSYVTKKFPIGPVSLVTPFNFPMNLLAHKVAPAIAAGCPFVLKPSSRTPVSALMIGEILAETELPAGAFSILPCSREDADLFTTDERLKLLSFTGSASSGWDLKSKAGKKSVILELGGNAACVVDWDQQSNLKHVADRIIYGGFYQAGQSCISVQRTYIQADIYGELAEMLIARARMLKSGDPLDEKTFVGPMISEKEAERVESWVKEAVKDGAHLLVGKERNGTFFYPTILENVDPSSKVYSEEVFGPVVVLEAFSEWHNVMSKINESKYGLQAGVFTDSLQKTIYAFNTLEVGGVVVGDVPSVRVDSMPYGGVKDSGVGREGVKSAIDHMTETRTLVMKNIGVRSDIHSRGMSKA
jgi:acyl-CoA reductase-like NAD-dependent aldehyde dehydrogenase